jgi:hypothetical protein
MIENLNPTTAAEQIKEEKVLEDCIRKDLEIEYVKLSNQIEKGDWLAG